MKQPDMQHFLQEKILNMSRAIETGRIRQLEVQKSQREHFNMTQSYKSLKLKHKEAVRLMHSTSKQVEEIELHYFLIRTDWAALIRIIQVLHLIYTGLKSYVKEHSPLYRRLSLVIKLKYLVRRYTHNRRMNKKQFDAGISQSCLHIAAGVYREKTRTAAMKALGPLFGQFKIAYDIKSRLLRFNLVCMRKLT